jgi:hypothetical protein
MKHIGKTTQRRERKRRGAQPAKARVAVTRKDAGAIPPRPGFAPVTEFLTNASLAELLAREADKVTPALTRAFRRASRRAFLWPEEAADLIRSGRSLTELQGIGPYLEKVLKTWLADPPPDLNPPALRQNFLTFTEARSILADNPAWLTGVKGDLQMHSTWYHPGSPPCHRHDCESLEDSVLRFAIVNPRKVQMTGFTQNLQVS